MQDVQDELNQWNNGTYLSLLTNLDGTVHKCNGKPRVKQELEEDEHWTHDKDDHGNEGLEVVLSSGKIAHEDRDTVLYATID